MRTTVKFNVHDWPKRGDASKREVVVDAKDDVEARALADIEAQHNWPGGKYRAFDVVVDRAALYEDQKNIEPSTPPINGAALASVAREKLKLRGA